MDASSNTTTAPQTIWRLLIGLFGADVVKRKFGSEPPHEWEALLIGLSDFEINRGMRRVVYNGRRDVPSLPEFIRLCRSSGAPDIDEGPLPQPVALAPPDRLDRWTITANHHLFNYLRKRIMRQPNCYGVNHSPAQERCVGLLVAAKNEWATVMRESVEPDGSVDVDTQKAFWKHYIGQAEIQIKAIIHG